MPRPPTYATAHERAQFARWLEGEREARRVTKGKIAAELGHDSIQHVNKLLSGKSIPMPDTLRVLCEVVGLSWPEAYARAGYIGEILRCLAGLRALAVQWRLEDKAFPGIEDQAQFRSVGVLKLGEKLVLEALSTDPRLASRYIMGYWEEDNSNVEADPDVPQHIIDFANRPRRPIPVFVPKPLAVAVIVAVAGFPRRGDVWQDGRSTYAAEVMNMSQDLFDAAVSVPLRSMPSLLRKANEVLQDKSLARGLRRAIAAEYLNDWADLENSYYTHDIRLGAYAYWGEAGSSESSVTAFGILPQIRKTQLPIPDALALNSERWDGGRRPSAWVQANSTEARRRD